MVRPVERDDTMRLSGPRFQQTPKMDQVRARPSDTPAYLREHVLRATGMGLRKGLRRSADSGFRLTYETVLHNTCLLSVQCKALLTQGDGGVALHFLFQSQVSRTSDLTPCFQIVGLVNCTRNCSAAYETKELSMLAEQRPTITTCLSECLPVARYQCHGDKQQESVVVCFSFSSDVLPCAMV